MSGHSHWATIKRKKESNDQERGRVFSKLTRDIILAISQGNGVTDPEKNVHLRAAIEKAKENNMPKDNITRLIERMKQRSEAVTEVVYEALGPDPVNFIIKTATDNPRRTQTDIRIILEKNGGKLVEKGGVMYNYDQLAMFTVDRAEEEPVLELIEKLGALDFEKEENVYYIYVPFTAFSEAWKTAKELGFARAPEVVYKAKLKATVTPDVEEKAYILASKIEEVEEVQAVYFNL